VGGDRRPERVLGVQAVDDGDLTQLFAVLVDVGEERGQRDDITPGDAVYTLDLVDTDLTAVQRRPVERLHIAQQLQRTCTRQVNLTNSRQ